MIPRPLNVGLFWVLFTTGAVLGQTQERTATGPKGLTFGQIAALGPEYDHIKPLVGNWQVWQRVWPKAGAEPIAAPAFQVRRQLKGHFLEEIMEPLPGTEREPFSRTAYINFNNVNRQWEYIVLDTRFPLMMFETSVGPTLSKGKEITLYLPAFVMPPFGDGSLAGQLTKQRRTVTFEGPNRNVVRQYWTLSAGEEYFAIEYEYQRQTLPDRPVPAPKKP